jgi:hypothetical protein
MFSLMLSTGLFLGFLLVVEIITTMRGGPDSDQSGSAIFPTVLVGFAFWLVLFVLWRARRKGPPEDRPDPPPQPNSAKEMPRQTPGAGLPSPGLTPPPHWPPITYDGYVRGVRRVLWHSRRSGQLRIEQEALIMGNRRTAYRYGRDRVRGLRLSRSRFLSIEFVDGRQASRQFVQTRQIDPRPDMAEALRNRGWQVVDERLPIARL